MRSFSIDIVEVVLVDDSDFVKVVAAVVAGCLEVGHADQLHRERAGTARSRRLSQLYPVAVLRSAVGPCVECHELDSDLAADQDTRTRRGPVPRSNAGRLPRNTKRRILRRPLVDRYTRHAAPTLSVAIRRRGEGRRGVVAHPKKEVASDVGPGGCVPNCPPQLHVVSDTRIRAVNRGKCGRRRAASRGEPDFRVTHEELGVEEECARRHHFTGHTDAPEPRLVAVVGIAFREGFLVEPICRRVARWEKSIVIRQRRLHDRERCEL